MHWSMRSSQNLECTHTVYMTKTKKTSMYPYCKFRIRKRDPQEKRPSATELILSNVTAQWLWKISFHSLQLWLRLSKETLKLCQTLRDTKQYTWPITGMARSFSSSTWRCHYQTGSTLRVSTHTFSPTTRSFQPRSQGALHNYGGFPMQMLVGFQWKQVTEITQMVKKHVQTGKEKGNRNFWSHFMLKKLQWRTTA